MSDLREAAEMALAKLDHLWEIAVDERMETDVLPEIKALREALAQPDEVLAEREACAKVCDDFAAQDKLSNYYAVAAKAIRARGER